MCEETSASSRTIELTGGLGRPSKVVAVGHSSGTYVSRGVTAIAPEIVDALVLTGYSGTSQLFSVFEAAVGLRVAALQDKSKWGSFQCGYIISVDKYSDAISFCETGLYDRQILEFREQTKTPFTAAGLVTLAFPSVPSYTGPVKVIKQ
jgi:pimeloyl-ACP methyl ester carboxylesterase